MEVLGFRASRGCGLGLKGFRFYVLGPRGLGFRF